MKEISSVREFTDELDHKSIKELISTRGIEEKEKVLKYLKSFAPDCATGMSLVDEITGEDTGLSVDGFEDEKYYWDSRYVYHFEKYNLVLNEDFINHVLTR